MRHFMLLPLAALVACDAPETATPAPKPIVAAKTEPAFSLAGLTQEARVQACNERLAHYRDLGVWAHGGVRPGVEPGAWEMLDEREQNEIFLTAACIATGGQPGERIVTVVRAGNGPDIESRRMTVPE